MPKLDALNVDHPPELLCKGTELGAGLDLDLSTLSDHVSSRAVTVSRCSRRGSNTLNVVIKAVFAPDVRPPHDVRNEACAMASLGHANICALLNAYFVDSHFILVLPFYPFTLRNLLDNSAFRPEVNAIDAHDDGDGFEVVSRAIIAQMCAAVAYLEEEGVAHRDVSPSNWLLSCSGRTVLCDFGTAWRHGQGAEGKILDFELGTGGYRAPELLFGSRSYDPICIDRWSLGCCIAEFFTPFVTADTEANSDESSDEGGNRVPASPWDAAGQRQREPIGGAGQLSPRPAWMGPATRAHKPKPRQRSALFDGGWSDFALIGSIFKTLGTPTRDTWPEASSLPDFGKFSFKVFPPRSLADPSLLPNLPASEPESAADLVQRFLVYPFQQRLSASEALQHPYLFSQDATNEQRKDDLRKHIARWL